MFTNQIFFLCVSLFVSLAYGKMHFDLMNIKPNMNILNSIYYDPVTNKSLMGNVEDVGRITASSIMNFKGLPCTCANLVCGCCTGVKLNFIKFDRRVCTNVTYVPQDFALQMNLLMDDKEIFSNKISAKNPPAMCVPMPYVPFVSFCMRLHDIYTQGTNLHTCLDFQTKIIEFPVLVLHFDCVKMGTDGVAWFKPGESCSTQNPQITTNLVDGHDPVNFEPENESTEGNQTSILDTIPPEEETQIGQLKL